MAGSPPGAGPFCESAWTSVGRLVDAIVDHPFNRTLADGGLDPEVFTFYVEQDALYLEGFARALSAAAVRAPHAEDSALWSDAAHEALGTERALHERWLARRGAGLGPEAAPTCFAYTSWLEAVALRGPYPVQAASLLPCYWVYERVGRSTLEASGRRDSSSHPYAEWISTYSDPEYAELVSRVRAATERAWAGAGGGVRKAMLETFARGTELEWMFWDAAWRREQWPTVGYRGIDDVRDEVRD